MNDSNLTDNLASENKYIYEALAKSLPSPTATVTRAGVVQLPGYDTSFLVNQDDIMQLIEEAVEKINPKKDYDGKFAGRVTVRIEVWGELEEKETAP